MTARRIAAAFLAMLGAVGVTASAYLNWYADSPPESIPLDRLFETGITEEATSYWMSVALPLALVTVVALVGVLLRSRLVVLVAWLIGLATLVLFVVMQAREDAEFSFGDLQTGVWVALAGLIVMLIGLVNIEPPAPVLESEEPLTVMQTDRYAPAPPPPPADTTVLDTHRWSGPTEPYPPERYSRTEPDDATRPIGLPYGAPEPHHEPEPETQLYSAPEPHHEPEPDALPYSATESEPETQLHAVPEAHHEPEPDTQVYSAPEPHHEPDTEASSAGEPEPGHDAEARGESDNEAHTSEPDSTVQRDSAPPSGTEPAADADKPSGASTAPEASPDAADAEDDRPRNG